MKRCRCLAFGIVLFQLQLLCNGQPGMPNPNIEGPHRTQQNIVERDKYVSRGLSNRGNSTVQGSPTQTGCHSIDLPKDYRISGPIAGDASLGYAAYTRLCPRQRGIFEVSTTCNMYVTCSGGCLAFYRCPQFQNFNPETNFCVAAERYRCSKPEPTWEWSDIIRRYTSNTPNGVAENPRIGTKIYIGNNMNVNGENNSRSGNERVILQEAPTRKEANGVTQKLHPTSGNGGPSLRSLQSESTSISGSQIDCKEEQVGNFAHPESCHLYIECANGNQLTKRCPPGSVFNPDLTVCDWSRNVPECNTESDNSKLKHSISQHNRPELTYLSGTRANQKSIKRSVPSSTPKSSKLCTASESYIEPHPEYCNKYQVCSNGRRFVENCGPGTLFDPLNSVCNFPDRVDCESRKADLGTYGCQKQHTYRTSHWEFCNKFVECDKGVLAIKTCPSGLVYDVDSTNCGYAHKIECRKPISLEHDTDINKGQPVAIRSVRSISDYICEFNYIAPHPRCNKFVECEEKTLFVKSCGPGTVYNKYIGQCDWAYNTREPADDETDCSAYRECKGGEWKGRHCGDGFRFNPKTLKCDRSEIVECRREKEVPTAESK